MIAGYARVAGNERLYGRTFVCWFSSPDLSRSAYPGQFVMLRCAEPSPAGEGATPAAYLSSDPLLPRAMSIHRVRETASGPEWSVLYDKVGRGTEWLASRKVDDLVYAWGPLGKGFEVDPGSSNLLLVAGGVGVAPLVWLADKAIASGKEVVLIVGGHTRDQVLPAAFLPPQIEVVVMTEDGTLGRQGRATEAFEQYIAWSDQVFACGPTAMFSTMQQIAREMRTTTSIQVLLEERMGCGTGICYGCTVSTRRGLRLVCKDGPRFELREVAL
jgi:dihydroorotate dehydrogenase electron transfer subunit